ncbi:hypothetical protein [Methanomassiliicoccus luminyensis]|uniref:hypothetical protein n=1 Tax=Methanomassiliicoccus luminyensis TaxID=1080712 RepID=UPI000377C96C|nr:hypothetical protein [Methanomassiliicoccus luminyensis]
MGKSETLLQVKDAEAKAKLLIEQADEKQRAIIAAARRDAADRIQKAESASKANSESQLAEEKRILAIQRDELLKKGTGESNILGTKANDRVPKAKAYIRQHLERTFDVSAGTNE